MAPYQRGLPGRDRPNTGAWEGQDYREPIRYDHEQGDPGDSYVESELPEEDQNREQAAVTFGRGSLAPRTRQTEFAAGLGRHAGPHLAAQD